MKILALDTSATPASVALVEDNFVLGEFYINVKLTHSQTLMTMVQSLLDNTKIELKNVDAFAVSVGPGSFTGVRIGISAIKGMAYALNKPCIPVSTLHAMAFNFVGQENSIICAVMDARCNQVYNAFFRVNDYKIERLENDRAISIDQLYNDIKTTYAGQNIILVGDGAELCYNKLGEKLPNLKLSPGHLLYQRAFGVSQVSLNLYNDSVIMSSSELNPVYLRMPQAERELKKRISLSEGN